MYVLDSIENITFVFLVYLNIKTSRRDKQNII